MSFDDEDLDKIYQYCEYVRNTEQREINGENKSILLPSFDSLRPSLSKMEAMAREIEFDSDSKGFDIKRDRIGRPRVVSRLLGRRYFYPLKTFFRIHAFENRNVYSTHVWAVCEAFKALNLHPLAFRFGDPGSIDPASGKLCGEVFNDVVSKVAGILASTSFKERLRVRRRNAKRNEEKGLAVEQKVFEKRSRQLVLMLHFGYQHQYRSSISFEECQIHRKTFFNNARSNKLLRGMEDYIWKLEEGEESGIHLHMLIFYTTDSCRDVYIAKLIGEYWVKVTEGKGQYWNSNANKEFHERHGHGIGTGEINWNDHAKRESLRKNIRYMTKADQFLKVKYGERSRLFGTSEVGVKKKAGRPRSVP